MKKVSLITCCYNGKDFIERCFSCILQQTYKNIEFIFVDDGSTDDSYNIAKSFKEKFEFEGIDFIALKETNKGIGGATAFALLHANGDYICNLDVDDILYPTSIEKRVLFLEDNPTYAIVRTNGYKVGKNIKQLFVPNDAEKRKTDIFEEILLGRTNNWPGSYMVRSNKLWSIYKDKHIYDSRYGQNMQILLAVAYQNKSGFIDEPLMEYTFNPKSITNKKTTIDYQSRLLEGFKDIRISIMKKLGIVDSDLYTKLDTYYNRLFMDLALNYNDKQLYISNYNKFSKAQKPDLTYTYNYYRFKT